MAVEEPTVVVAPAAAVVDAASEVTAPVVVKDAALDGKIIRQVEYYFGDMNMTKDKFMQEEIQKDEGWVSLETLIKFNRLKQLSSDFSTIISALKKSTSELLEIDEEKQRVRRLKALPENPTEFETTLKQNTCYVKGFPESMNLDELITFFEQHGKVLQVFMRRIPMTKAFKGSVFVTFDSSEESTKFMELSELKHNDQVLERETQGAYLTRKAPALARMKEDKEKREADKEAKRKEREEAEAAFYASQKVNGSVLHLTGLPAEGTRENLKELFDNHAKVKWVDYSKGEPEAFLRFVEADKAKMALEAVQAGNDGKVTLMGADLTVRVLEGEEEEKFWKDTISKLVEAKKNKNSRGRGGNRSGKGDWKRNNDRDNENNKRSNDGDGENDQKKTKTE